MEKDFGLDGLQGFVVLRCLNSHPCVYELEAKVSTPARKHNDEDVLISSFSILYHTAFLLLAFL